MRVILSHPYAGALHWWLQSTDRYAHSRKPDHPYYRHLYGPVDGHMDIALACVVIFEEVLIAAADTRYPEADFSLGDRFVRVPSIGLAADWEPVRAAYDFEVAAAEVLLADGEVSRILRRVPASQKSFVLRDVFADCLMMKEYSAPLICSVGRRALILRLSELDALPGFSTTAVEKAPSTHADALGPAVTSKVRDYVRVVGLTFKSPDVSRLSTVKSNGLIRDYADSFQQVIIQGDASAHDLYGRIEKAWTNRTIAQEASAAFSTTSRALSLVSLVPGAGTVAELFGMSADAGSLAAERRATKNSWFELGPEINRVESLAGLEAELASHGFRPQTGV